MKKTKILLTALLVTFFYAPDSFSHNGWFKQDRCNWRTENSWKRTGYAQENLVNIQGEILSRELVPSISGRDQGVHLVIKTDEGNLRVILGPEWYLSTQNVNLDLGGGIEVTGTRVTYQEEATLVAFRVIVEDGTLYLRNENGISVWSRRRCR
jgi:hypothetical protein